MLKNLYPYSILFFENKQGNSFSPDNKFTNLSSEVGWWFSIHEKDIDFDGDKDYVVGNLGLNYKYKASKVIDQITFPTSVEGA